MRTAKWKRFVMALTWSLASVVVLKLETLVSSFQKVSMLYSMSMCWLPDEHGTRRGRRRLGCYSSHFFVRDLPKCF
jgi:hypothetical protein